MDIILLTQDQTARLHRTEIADRDKPPDVIGWKSQVFKRVGYDGKVVVYAECVALALPDD